MCQKSVKLALAMTATTTIMTTAVLLF